MKTNKIISIILIQAFLVACVCGCSSFKQKSIVGQWYNKKEKCLDIRADGTWKLDGSYGTGTYKLLDDKKTFEFADYYGDTQKSEILEDELGMHIDFGYYGVFYKDSYPPKDKIEEAKAKNAISLNPFEGIKYEISGISPYCKVAINNSDCAEEVQKYVKYKLDKETYANGETAIVTAELSSNTGENAYKLTAKNAQCTVSGQPEYVSSVEGIKLDALKKELNDFVKANIAEAVKRGTEGFMYSSVLGTGVSSELKKVENLTAGNVYFQSKKLQKQSDSSDYFNYLTFTYSGAYVGKYASGNFYSCVSAVNIIRYPDGSIKWGSKSPDNYDFISEGSTEGMEYTVSAFITAHSSDYNITKVENK